MCQTLSSMLNEKHVHEGGVRAHFTDRDTEVEINEWGNLPVASLFWTLMKDKLRVVETDHRIIDYVQRRKILHGVDKIQTQGRAP